jgi:hypothetical protein
VQCWNKPVVDVFCTAEAAPAGVKATITATAARVSAFGRTSLLLYAGERNGNVYESIEEFSGRVDRFSILAGNQRLRRQQRDPARELV